MKLLESIFRKFGYMPEAEALVMEMKARQFGFEQGCQYCGRTSSEVWNPPFTETKADLAQNVVAKARVRRKHAVKAAEINPLNHEQTK